MNAPAQDYGYFASLAALRGAHAALMQRYKQDGDDGSATDAILAFVDQGRRTGALLAEDDDRWAAQSMLDYWSTVLYRSGDRSIDTTLDAFDPDLAPELPDEACPYVGLASFDESRANLLFGRHRLQRKLLDTLAGSRLLAVIGSSGSGKSSAVKAGLIPALKRGEVPARDGWPGSEAWRYLPLIVPGVHPLTNLAAACQDLAATGSTRAPRGGPIATAGNDTDATANGGPAPDSDAPASGLAELAAADRAAPLVLVVDQFEEVFTLCTDASERQAFVAALTGLITAPGVPHRVIVTMRTDFTDRIARFEDFSQRFDAARVDVLPMSAAEIREAILGPAEIVGLKFEDGVVDRLVADILGEPAGLPLLQFTLLKLWEKREGNRITLASYLKLGGGRESLSRSADAFYEGLIAEQQETAKRIFLRLVRPGEGVEFTSRRVPIAELNQAGEATDRVKVVLEKLIKAHLLKRTEGDIEGGAQVEVAHEALIRNWRTLVGWLETEREAIRKRQRLTGLAAEWDRIGRMPAALLRGEVLAEMLRYADLSPLEREFIRSSAEAERSAELEKEASRHRELQRAKRDQRVFAVFSVVAIALAVFALLQWHRANREAESAAASARDARGTTMALKAQNAVQYDNNPALGILRAMHAIGTTAQDDDARRAAENALRMALAVPARPAVVLQSAIMDAGLGNPPRAHRGEITALAVSADGRWLASTGPDMQVNVWDLSDTDATAAGPATRISLGRPVAAIAISGNSRWLAVAAGSDVILLDLADPWSGPRVVQRHSTAITALAFTVDGESTKLAAGAEDGAAWLWMQLDGDTDATPLSLDQVTNDSATDGTGTEDDLDQPAPEGTVAPPDPFSPIELPKQAQSILALAFNPNGPQLIAVGDFGTVILALIDHSGALSEPAPLDDWSRRPVSSLMFSADGRWLSILMRPGVPCAIEGRSLGRYTRALTLPSPICLDRVRPPMRVLGFHDNTQLLLASPDHTVMTWDFENPAAPPRALTKHAAPVESTGFLGTSILGDRWRFDVTRDGLGGLSRLDADDLSVREQIPWVGSPQPITSAVVALRAEVTSLFLGGSDGSIAHWQIALDAPLVSPRVLHDIGGGTKDLALSQDGLHVAAVSEAGTLRLWDLSKDPNTTPPTTLAATFDLEHSVVAFDPLEPVVAIGTEAGHVHLWRYADPAAPVRTLPLRRASRGPITKIAFSADGQWLGAVSAADTGEGLEAMVSLWPRRPALVSTAAGNRAFAGQARVERFDADVTVFRFSPDNRWLVVAEEGSRTAQIWRLGAASSTSGQEIARLRGHRDGVTAAAFSQSGRRLATADGNGTVRAWDLDASRSSGGVLTLSGSALVPVRMGKVPAQVLDLAFDGADPPSLLAAGSDDGLARVWRLGSGTRSESSTGNAPTTLVGHSDYVRRVLFPGDGSTLMTTSDDGTARIWPVRRDLIDARTSSADDVRVDVETSTPNILAGHQGWITMAEASPDGRWLITATDSDSPRVWDLRVDTLIASACGAAGRNPTWWAEWQDGFAQAQVGASQERSFKVCQDLAVHPSIVETLREQALALAQEGNRDQAVARLELVKSLDPRLTFEPESEITRVEVLALLESSYGYIDEGDVDSALEAYGRAKALGLGLGQGDDDTIATTLNTICWNGSLMRRARDVMDACELAVAISRSPETPNGNPNIRDSRGLARALTGNRSGAIADFEYYVADVYDGATAPDGEEDLLNRRRWIASLKAGQDPFVGARFETLLEEAGLAGEGVP